MRFYEWRRWVLGLPWALRWFVYLILARSSLDALYFLKEISPLLSPLYFIGVLTPVGICLSFLFLPARRKGVGDLLIGLLGALLLLNALAALTLEMSIQSLELAVKLVGPVLLFFFVRHLVRSREDLRGVLTTFLYSTIIPFGMIVYERAVAPLGAVIETRGFVRYEGLYADAVSYAIYITGGLVISCYFFLEREGALRPIQRIRRLVVVGGLCLLGLLTIHHTTSWGVFLVLLVLLSLHVVGRGRLSLVLVLLLVGTIGYYFAGDAVIARVEAGLQTDIAVIEGDRDVEQAFHGRMWRWKRYVAHWQDMPAAAWVFGVSVTAQQFERTMIGSGIHSDYLRILFAAGALGLALYLAFFGLLFFNAWRESGAERFLILGMAVVVLMYSITTCPTFYAPLMYLSMAVFSYAVRPRQDVHASTPVPSSLSVA